MRRGKTYHRHVDIHQDDRGYRRGRTLSATGSRHRRRRSRVFVRFLVGVDGLLAIHRFEVGVFALFRVHG